jgi:hypothetical protein
MIIFNLNFRLALTSGDTLPASLLPFSILERASLNFDQFSGYIQTINVNYMFGLKNNHYVSVYPIVTPILITPLYLIPYVLLKIVNYPIDMLNPGFQVIVGFMERFSATIIATLASISLYLVLQELCSKKIAFITSCIFAFATNTWATSSMALWQHGMVELLFILMVFLILFNEKHSSYKNIIFLGILSGLFIFNRPSDALLILPVILYIFLTTRKNIILYSISGCLICLPFLYYNILNFGNALGGYNSVLSMMVFNPDTYIESFAGLLGSPQRGLLIFTPITIIAVFGYFKINTINNNKIKIFLKISALTAILQILIYSFFTDKWQGAVYGPRFLVGILPILCIFIGLYLESICRNKNDNMTKFHVNFIVIMLLVGVSIFVQIVGVCYYPNGDVKVVYDTSNPYAKYWDWSDTQIMRNFYAGQAIANPIKFVNMILFLENYDIINYRDSSIKNIALYDGWGGLESAGEEGKKYFFRWIGQNATLYLNSNKDMDITLNFNAEGFNQPKSVAIIIDNTSVNTIFINSSLAMQHVSTPLSINQKTKIIKLEVNEGCKRPIDLGIPGDNRCLGVAISNISVRIE